MFLFMCRTCHLSCDSIWMHQQILYKVHFFPLLCNSWCIPNVLVQQNLRIRQTEHLIWNYLFIQQVLVKHVLVWHSYTWWTYNISSCRGTWCEHWPTAWFIHTSQSKHTGGSLSSIHLQVHSSFPYIHQLYLLTAERLTIASGGTKGFMRRDDPSLTVSLVSVSITAAQYVSQRLFF